ncbi:hypothetical protein ScPMuIL_002213, partial [Solemya velum]
HLLVGYEPIIQHLTQIQNPADPAHRKDSAAKGQNFIKLLTSMDVVCYLFFLWDVVNELAKVSEVFQQQSSNIADIHQELNAAKCLLSKYKDTDGPNLKKIAGRTEYKGTVLKGSLSSFTSTRAKMIDALLNSLSNRFEADEELLKASSVVQLDTWPEKISEELDF